jgi:hypothetical protein
MGALCWEQNMLVKLANQGHLYVQDPEALGRFRIAVEDP